MLDNVPHDIAWKILDQLKSKERAQLAVVSKSWQQISLSTFTELSVEGINQELNLNAWLHRMHKVNPCALQYVDLPISLKTDARLSGTMALSSNQEFIAVRR